MSVPPSQVPGDAQDTIRVQVNLVTLGVRVADRKGQEIGDLKISDFQVFEDGKRQRIDFFAAETQPLSLGILFDTSGSMSTYKLQSAKAAALYLLESPSEPAEFLFNSFDDEVRGTQRFDTNRRSVADVLMLTGSSGGGTSLYDAVSVTLEQFAEARHGRQALVVITDGVDQHSRRTLEDVIQIVQQSQVQVYIVGYFEYSEEAMFRESGEAISLVTGKTVANPLHAFRRLSEESGATAYFPTSGRELDLVSTEIAKDISRQYTLAYYSPNPQSAHYRRIEVKVRRSGAQTRHRRGYRIRNK